MSFRACILVYAADILAGVRCYRLLVALYVIIVFLVCPALSVNVNLEKYLPFAVSLQGASISEANGLYACTSSSFCTSIDTERAFAISLVHKVGREGIMQRRWYVIDTRVAGKQVFGVVETEGETLALHADATHSANTKVDGTTPIWMLRGWKRIGGLGVGNVLEPTMELSFFRIGCETGITLFSNSTTSDDKHGNTHQLSSQYVDLVQQVEASVALYDLVSLDVEGSGNGNANSGSVIESSRGLACRCVRSLLSAVLNESAYSAYFSQLTSSWTSESSQTWNLGAYLTKTSQRSVRADTTVFGDRTHGADRSVLETLHIFRHIIDHASIDILSHGALPSSLCHWAVLEGSWAQSGRTCYETILFSNANEGGVDSQEKGALMPFFWQKQGQRLWHAQLLHYAMLCVSMDVDPSTALAALDQAENREYDGASAANISSRKVLRQIAQVLLHAEFDADQAGDTDDCPLCLQRMCSTLQKRARAADLISIADLLVQVCHHIATAQLSKSQSNLSKNPFMQTVAQTVRLTGDHAAALAVSLFSIGAVSVAGTHVCSAVVNSLLASTVDVYALEPAFNATKVLADFAALQLWCRQYPLNSGNSHRKKSFGNEFSPSLLFHEVTKALSERSCSCQMSESNSEEFDSCRRQCLFPKKIAFLLKSVHVQEATRLYQLLAWIAKQEFVLDGKQVTFQRDNHGQEYGHILSAASVRHASITDNVIALLVSNLLQTAAPQVIQSRAATGEDTYADVQAEVQFLHFVSTEAVDLLLDPICARNPTRGSASHMQFSILSEIASSLHVNSSCTIRDPVSSIGVRGLFLQAYQGLCAQTGHTICAAMSSRYLQLMQITQLHWPWEYPPPSLLREAAKSRPSVALRVAFVSSFFREHSVGRLLANVIRGLIQIEGENIKHKGVSSLDVHVVDISLHQNVNSFREHVNTGAPREDPLTRSLRESMPPEQWHAHGSKLIITGQEMVAEAVQLVPSNPASVVRYLRALRCDIVVYADNFMDSVTAHALMMRAAPVQVLFWGHPFTSGFPTVDYFISADSFELESTVLRSEIGIPGTKSHTSLGRGEDFSEQLLRFNSLSFLMYQDAEPASSSLLDPYVNGSPSLLSQLHAVDLNGRRANLSQLLNVPSYNECQYCSHAPLRFYSSLQSLMKMHPAFDRAVVDILTGDPRAVVLLLSGKRRQGLWHEMWVNRLKELILDTARIKLQTLHGHENSETIASLAQIFADEISSRLLFFRQMSHSLYKTLLCELSDVVLDPFPFGGGVTLVDALTCSRKAQQLRSSGPTQPDRAVIITSGSLQSVHQLGSGIATRLGKLNVEGDDTSGIDIKLASGMKAFALSAVSKCCDTINDHWLLQDRNANGNIEIKYVRVSDSDKYSCLTEPAHVPSEAATCVRRSCTLDSDGNLLAITLNYIATNMSENSNKVIDNRVSDFVASATCVASFKGQMHSATQAVQPEDDDKNTVQGSGDATSYQSSIKRYLFGNSSTLHLHETVQEWHQFLIRVA